VIEYPAIDPVAIYLGPLQIRWYGISYVVAILLGWWLMKRRALRDASGWTDEQVADLVFYATLGLLLGGRLGEALFYNFAYYASQPLAIFRIWEGGMSFHGGIIGGTLGACWFARAAGKRYSDVCDRIAAVIPVGLGLGRIANFVNGELWGKPSDLPWAMVFPHPDAGGIARHPSQLYEAFLEGLVLFVVMWWFTSRPRPAWAASGLFFLVYGLLRFAVEFVREPDAHIGYLAWGWLTMGQLLCVPMVLAGAAGIWYCARLRSR
jgi:phosphatidylglycerol:prolipoprotein diacylglycerol transferase